MVAHKSESIDDEFFLKSREWYYDKYLKPITERVWAAVLLLSAIICFAVHFTATYVFFPLDSPYPFAMYVQGNNDDLHIIRTLSSKHSDSTQVAFAEYLIAYYVKMWEEYDYQNLEKQKEYIKNNSSRAVYNNFINHLDVHYNQDSPILKYKKDGKRIIEILDLEIYGTGSGTNNAKIQFISSDSKTNAVKENNVMLRFTLSDMAAVVKSAPLEFRVLSYGK